MKINSSIEGGALPRPAPSGLHCETDGPSALSALCVLARYHQIPADPATLAHQLGLQPSQSASTDDVLRAAKHLGLKAKLSRTTLERLTLSPLPALALLRADDGSLRTVVLAQCDGQRVLLQDPGAPGTGARPIIESMEAFAAQWSGELILITSRASLAGELAKFDFSWFIPSLIKHRKLLGEVLFISFMLQLFALVSPLFFQVVMDKVLVHRGITTLDVLVIGLVVVVVFESLLNGLRCAPMSSATPPAASMWSWAPGCSGTWCSCRWPTSRHGAWATRSPACASWRTSAAS